MEELASAGYDQDQIARQPLIKLKNAEYVSIIGGRKSSLREKLDKLE